MSFMVNVVKLLTKVIYSKTSMYFFFVKVLLFSIEFASTIGMIFSHGNITDFNAFARYNRFLESHNFDSVRRLQFCGTSNYRQMNVIVSSIVGGVNE